MLKSTWVALGALGATVFLGTFACDEDAGPRDEGLAVGSQPTVPGDGTASNTTGAGSSGAATDAPAASATDTGSTAGTASTAEGPLVNSGAPSNTTTAPSTSDTASTGSSAGPEASASDTASTGSSAAGGAPGTGTSTPDPTAGGAGGTEATPEAPPLSDVTGAGMSAGKCTLGAGQQEGQGQTTEQYLGADVTRDGLSYRMITNGWGMNWQNHDISWLGSSMSINTYAGSRQSNGAPAGYPSVFCGRYSDVSQACGLPKPLSSVTALNTAVSWSHPTGDGTYNVAYDVWLGDGQGMGFRSLQSYFMVWLKDPPGENPAGSLQEQGVTVSNAPGVWDIIAGTVNGLPIVNYVRAEGDELQAMAFDIMDFIRDAQARNLQFPGNDLLAVAIGFEIWQGPVTGLKLEDFCLDIQ